MITRGTNYTLRIKEQEQRLTVNEHDVDDNDKQIELQYNRRFLP